MSPKVHSRPKRKRNGSAHPLPVDNPFHRITCLRTIASPRRQLCLCRSRQSTDAGLVRVSSLQRLRHLVLECCCKITDAGLVSIAGLQQLRHLDLTYCYRITDAGVVSIASLQQLRYLILGRCNKITDAGHASIALLQQLQHLDLAFCRNFTGAGLVVLPHCSTLASAKQQPRMSVLFMLPRCRSFVTLTSATAAGSRMRAL
ncbi:receptor-type protein kinase, putative [Bodo saltans]|uniref:Receptor-type protein kinase, putative n=1 Tax=Bodo saltans TaxID=75058 RepID=A0A0S4JWK9_BODSA|nr:receptor-type protein kinase, putative [Bodo saltans]|eukprot:CUG93811.1 receptor-type protein kinase, putative [Bodo saltans]